MWDRFISYLLSGLAWLFVGPTSDHFQCLSPDHEVMLTQPTKAGIQEYVRVCVC